MKAHTKKEHALLYMRTLRNSKYTKELDQDKKKMWREMTVMKDRG